MPEIFLNQIQTLLKMQKKLVKQAPTGTKTMGDEKQMLSEKSRSGTKSPNENKNYKRWRKFVTATLYW